MVFIPYIVLSCFLFVAMVNDLISYRVSNKLIVLGLIFAIMLQVSKYQAWGILYFLLGAMVPVLILFLLFLGNVLGAGDIKLFAVVGGSLGITIGIHCIWYSFVAGAILAIFLLIIRGNFLLRFQHFTHFISTCFICRSISVYCDKETRDQSKFHFTTAIFAGFLCLAIKQI